MAHFCAAECCEVGAGIEGGGEVGDQGPDVGAAAAGDLEGGTLLLGIERGEGQRMDGDEPRLAFDREAAAMEGVEPAAATLMAEAIGGVWRSLPVKSGRAALRVRSSGMGASSCEISPSASKVSETAPKRAVAV